MKTPESCPECGCCDINPEVEERCFASCNDCGHVFYDDWTLEIQNEVRREQRQCKQILGYVPSYAEAIKKGLIKP